MMVTPTALFKKITNGDDTINTMYKLDYNNRNNDNNNHKTQIK